ncbi:hypothetical protein HNY73_020317 [Argiope bruennichi]|uniref:Uncharacterized protein n=1 Tax=Argiope bruennichi TaxID=94029 RepID=A0A8T0E7I4_ARGBR|nr:hypothetical protein HNY73_020317 [Argiope bruennichi]
MTYLDREAALCARCQWQHSRSTSSCTQPQQYIAKPQQYAAQPQQYAVSPNSMQLSPINSPLSTLSSCSSRSSSATGNVRVNMNGSYGSFPIPTKKKINEIGCYCFFCSIKLMFE